MHRANTTLRFLSLQLGAGVVLCCGCATQTSPEQAEVIALVNRLGGQVKYGEQHTVVEVALGGTHVSGSELARLSIFPDLKTLSLFDSSISDDDLARLAPTKTLETLYLGRTRITDDGLKHLAGLQKLRTLGLSDTRVTNQGLKQLASLSNLRSINVHRTQVTVTGGNDLKATLPQLVIHY